ncbi:MAG: hypothetical protein A2X29_12445 [Elusimicrobia bacterium GWA2_64_40]|nr:MAG: hypothetical protein A2X29_12445 [Elusimicrobia bacterium GWA2_64_40]OGR64492.1 MAG: hypothetical protein A2X30_00185 [Elusimicrobia bacterium GWB2_63_16]
MFIQSWLDRMIASPLLSRLAVGTFWSLAGLVASRLCGLLASVLIARVLGGRGFGELSIIQGTVGMFSVFAGFGLGMTVTKHIAEFRHGDPERAGRLIGLCSSVSVLTGALMSMLLVFLSDHIASRVLSAPHLSGLLSISAPLLLLGAWSGVQVGALSGLEAFKRIAKINLATGLLNFPLMVGGVLLGGLTGAVVGLLFVGLAGCLIGSWVLRSELRAAGINVRYSGFHKDAWILWKFTLPSLLSGLMVSPVAWACSAMLANQPDGYSELGVFNAANQWRLLSLSVPAILMQVTLPIMAGGGAGISGKDRRNQLLHTLKINFAIGSLLMVVFSLFSPFIMGWYGDGFRGRWGVFIVAQAVTFMQALQSPVVAYWTAQGEMWENFMANALWGGAVIFFSWICIGKGALGLMYGLFGGFAIFGVLILIKLQSVLRKDNAVSIMRI